MLKIITMKALVILMMLVAGFVASNAQAAQQKIYETEKAFEKMVAEKGIKAGFIEYLSPDSVIFAPEAVNGRERWKSRSPSPAALTWNPIWIDVSTNGALGYSIGNSIYRPKGKDDIDMVFGHYLSVWMRQPNGEYRAALDTGINHEKPASMPTTWKSPQRTSNTERNNGSLAADASTVFFETAEKQGAAKAYKMFLADDAYLLRPDKLPFVGKKAALDYFGKEKFRIKFAKRKSFTEAVDLAYVYNLYSKTDAAGTEIEKGNFVQVWKLINGKWQIVADAFIPIPMK